MKKIFVKIRNLLLDFLFPPRCVGCGTESAFLCFNCIRRLKISPSLMHYPEDGDLKGLIYIFKYGANPELKAAIHQFKYRFTTDLAETLAALMLKKLSRLAISSPILVPVPLHRQRRWWRGFNQSEELAKAMNRIAGLPVCYGLKRVKATEQQALLSRRERMKNLKNSFEALPELQTVSSDSTILLVDDVFTTGTTLNECARVLRNAGFKKVYGLVVAKA